MAHSKAWVYVFIFAFHSSLTVAVTCIISDIKRDIGWKSRFFHTLLYSTSPSGGPRRNIAIMFCTEKKLEWWSYLTVKKWGYVQRCPQNTGVWQTDRQTDRQTDIVMRRAVKTGQISVRVCVRLSARCQHFQQPKTPEIVAPTSTKLGVYIGLFYGSGNKTSRKQNFELRPLRRAGPHRTEPHRARSGKMTQPELGAYFMLHASTG